MCGRAVTGDVTWQQYQEWMNLIRTPGDPIRPNFNVAPTTMNPIFVPDGEGMKGVMARWGLVPNWFKKPLAEMKFTTFNARSEEAPENPPIVTQCEASTALCLRKDIMNGRVLKGIRRLTIYRYQPTRLRFALPDYIRKSICPTLKGTHIQY